MPDDNAKARKTPRTRRPSRTKLARDFYRSALEAAEKIELDRAAELEGLDEEIAVLRTKLRTALHDKPDDVALMMRGIELLVKAVSARYRLSSKESEDLSENLGRVVEHVGGLLIPESMRDG